MRMLAMQYCAQVVSHVLRLAQCSEKPTARLAADSFFLAYRLGAAFLALYEPLAASAAFQKGLELEPGNAAMKLQAEQSRSQADYERQCMAAYRGLYQRDLVLKLRAVSHHG